jgi:hypothetical protein
MLSASTQLAWALIELRIQQLREAAGRDQQVARGLRDRTRLYHQADAATWRAAMRPQWWRQAGAEDISRVWRAASTWQHVDPRAAEARRVVVERLAERGVRVDPEAGGGPSPQDVAWLSDALDQAAVDRAARAAAEASADRAEQNDGVDRGSSTAIDGEVTEPARSRPSARDREQKAADHVRAVWPAERAERVLACKAWPALAHQLGQLEEQGHDVEGLLRGVPAFVDQAHTPAAFAYRSIDDRLDGLVDLGTQRSTGGAPAGPAADPVRESTPTAAAATVLGAEPVGPEAVAAAAGGAFDAGRAPAATPEAASDGQAAQVAAQAYPIPTSEAVAAAASQAEAGTPVSGTPAVVAQPTREEPVSR